MFDYRLLALEHLLGTALLAGLTLYLSIRMPEPGALLTLRIALATEALAGLAAVPLFGSAPTRVMAWISMGVFVAAVAAFLAFGAITIRERIRAIKARRSKRFD